FGDNTLGWAKVDLPKEGVPTLRGFMLDRNPRAKKGDAQSETRLLLRAESAQLTYDARRRSIEFLLHNAEILEGPNHGSKQETLQFEFGLGARYPRDRPKFMTTAELVALKSRLVDQLRDDPGRRDQLRFKPGDVDRSIHERLAHAVTPIVFLLLGAPLALLFRSGNRL